MAEGYNSTFGLSDLKSAVTTADAAAKLARVRIDGLPRAYNWNASSTEDGDDLAVIQLDSVTTGRFEIDNSENQPVYLPSYAAVAALTLYKMALLKVVKTLAYYEGGNSGGGTFYYTTDEISPIQGVFVPCSDDDTGASGGMVRSMGHWLFGADFGLVADCNLSTGVGTDNSDAFNAIFSYFRTIGESYLSTDAHKVTKVFVPEGGFFHASSINAGAANYTYYERPSLHFCGMGQTKTFIVSALTSAVAAWDFTDQKYGVVEDITFMFGVTQSLQSVQWLVGETTASGVNQFRFERVRVYGINNDNDSSVQAVYAGVSADQLIMRDVNITCKLEGTVPVYAHKDNDLGLTSENYTLYTTTADATYCVFDGCSFLSTNAYPMDLQYWGRVYGRLTYTNDTGDSATYNAGIIRVDRDCYFSWDGRAEWASEADGSGTFYFYDASGTHYVNAEITGTYTQGAATASLFGGNAIFASVSFSGSNTTTSCFFENSGSIPPRNVKIKCSNQHGGPLLANHSNLSNSTHPPANWDIDCVIYDNSSADYAALYQYGSGIHLHDVIGYGDVWIPPSIAFNGSGPDVVGHVSAIVRQTQLGVTQTTAVSTSYSTIGSVSLPVTALNEVSATQGSFSPHVWGRLTIWVRSNLTSGNTADLEVTLGSTILCTLEDIAFEETNSLVKIEVTLTNNSQALVSAISGATPLKTGYVSLVEDFSSDQTLAVLEAPKAQVASFTAIWYSLEQA